MELIRRSEMRCIATVALTAFACSGNYRGGKDGGDGSDGGGDAGVGDGGGNSPCDLADPNSCGGGSMGCLPGPTAFMTHCGAMGTAQQYGPCSGTDKECAPGFQCRLTASMDCCACHAWCHWPGGACPTNTTCKGPVSNYNGVQYGECD